MSAKKKMVRSSSPGPGPEFTRAEAAAKFILKKTKLRPKIALVLGSGLGAFADEFADAVRIPYAKIPHFPRSTAIGHAGQLVLGKVENVDVVGMQGRVHLYEGYSAKDVAFPIRVFARLGVQAVILTNAAGGIKRNFTQGRLVVISDHINLQGANPLIGPNDELFGPRFPDMSVAYDKNISRIHVGRRPPPRHGSRRRSVCGTRGPQLRNSRGDSLLAFDRSGFSGHVHGSGSHRRAP